jgi:hypothetical protein
MTVMAALEAYVAARSTAERPAAIGDFCFELWQNQDLDA